MDRAVWGLAILRAGWFSVICHKFNESDADTSCVSGSGRNSAVIDMQASRFVLCSAVVLACALTGACSRRHYRERADRDVYHLLSEHTLNTPWEAPPGFTVYPDPRSRLADASPPDCPQLPAPGPVLYSPPAAAKVETDGAEELPAPAGTESSSAPHRLPPVEQTARHAAPLVRLVGYQQDASGEPVGRPAASDQAAQPVRPSTISGRSSMQVIPVEYWQSVPDTCLQRMLEFESVRTEYQRAFRDAAPPVPDAGQGLTLAQIVELASRNSREYQTQKEQLYTAALSVSLLRYEYELKFSPSGNGAALNYASNRDNGVTVNRLDIPSAYQIEKTLASGGQLLARFANDVLLTFNGPDGFTYDVGSELLFDFTQSILQRDIVLEPLSQAERDLVYAVRDYTRFRKEFFFNLASQYYGILRIYRTIEIDSQNYFSLVRTVEQSRAEIQAGVQNAPNQVAADQYEQSMLSGRRTLITSCIELEQALDRLKLVMGLPTEQPIDISLQELEQLTLQDETEVVAERVQRWRRRVQQQQQKPQLDRGELLNADVFLTERLLEWVRMRQKLQTDTPPPEQLLDRFRWFRIDQALFEAERNRRELQRASDPTIPQPVILLYRRTTDVVTAELELAQRQLDQLAATPTKEVDAYRERLRRAYQRSDELQGSVARILQGEQIALNRLLSDAQQLQTDVENLVQDLWRELEIDPQQTDAQRLQNAARATEQLLEITAELMSDSEMGLPAVELDVDDAMLTALVQRLDLMNERGLLADDWRRVKLAADDLRSVINLSASHRVLTDNNLPFDFDLDDSRTDLRLSLDLPLNRRASATATGRR